jgi:hypothetical protein
MLLRGAGYDTKVLSENTEAEGTGLYLQEEIRGKQKMTQKVGRLRKRNEIKGENIKEMGRIRKEGT